MTLVLTGAVATSVIASRHTAHGTRPFWLVLKQNNFRAFSSHRELVCTAILHGERICFQN